jgi:hypothetical protein
MSPSRVIHDNRHTDPAKSLVPDTPLGQTFAVRSLRSVKIGLVLVALATTLTACAPGRVPLLGITMIGGWPVAVLRTCAGGPAEISVTENSLTPTTSPGSSASPSPTPETPSPTVTPTTESYVFFWSVATQSADRLTEAPLFTTPTGWRVGGDTLKRLQPGARYIADAKVEGVFDVSPVNFTVTDLHDLKEGEILYGINAPLTTVLTRAEFESKTEQSCVDAHPSTTP